MYSDASFSSLAAPVKYRDVVTIRDVPFLCNIIALFSSAKRAVVRGSHAHTNMYRVME